MRFASGSGDGRKLGICAELVAY